MIFKKLTCLVLSILMLCSVMFTVACTSGEEADEPKNTEAVTLSDLDPEYGAALNRFLFELYTFFKKAANYQGTTIGTNKGLYPSSDIIMSSSFYHSQTPSDRDEIDELYDALPEKYDAFMAVTPADEATRSEIRAIYEEHQEYYPMLMDTKAEMKIVDYERYYSYFVDLSGRVYDMMETCLVKGESGASEQATALVEGVITALDDALDKESGTGQKYVILVNKVRSAVFASEYVSDLPDDDEHLAADASIRNALTMLYICVMVPTYAGETMPDDKTRAEILEMRDKLALIIDYSTSEETPE